MTQYQFRQSRNRRRPPRFDASNPQAIAICDGCGFLVQHNTLSEQREYRGGTVPVGTGVYKCPSCIDQPQPYFSRQLLRPDPVPVRNPRPDSNPTNRVLAQDSGVVLAQDGGDVLTQAGSDGGIAQVTEEHGFG